VNALVLLVAARLACWPFEVSGQGTPPADVHVPAPAPAPAQTAVSPSLPHDERIRYDISYGVLGSIGALQVSAGAVAHLPEGEQVVSLQGAGSGSVLGLGAMQNHIDSEFDARLLGARRWTFARGKPGQRADQQTVDTGAWDGRGEARLHRRKPGQPDEAYAFRSALQTSDPLGLIWRLRTAPPALGASDTLHVVDGLSLWRVRTTTVALAAAVPELDTTGIRVEGEVTPIFYDGLPDAGRSSRRFTMWMETGGSHVPLRIEIPLGPAHVVMRLVEAIRGPAAQVGAPVPGARSL
jgi:hypothetical protein